MAIIVRLDRVLADRKMQLSQLSDKVNVSIVNLSNLKTGNVKVIRFSTLNAIFKVLECQPGDILEYKYIGNKMGEMKNGKIIKVYKCRFSKNTILDYSFYKYFSKYTLYEM